MQPRTYELTGLALVGFCLGYLAPTWLPNPVATLVEVAATFVRLVVELTTIQSMYLGVVVGTVLVVTGFVLRGRRLTLEGGR